MNQKIVHPLKILALFAALSLALLGASPPDISIADSMPGSDLPRGFVTYSEGGETTGQPEAAGASVSCTIYASDPWKASPDVTGYGWQYCSEGFATHGVKITLQRHMWGTFWDNIDVKALSSSTETWLQDTVTATCHSGTYTYRIITDGYFTTPGGGYGEASVQSLNYLRTTC